MNRPEAGPGACVPIWQDNPLGIKRNPALHRDPPIETAEFGIRELELYVFFRICFSRFLLYFPLPLQYFDGAVLC